MLVGYYLDKNVTGKVLVGQLLELEPMGKEAKSIENILIKLHTRKESIPGLNLSSDAADLLLCGNEEEPIDAIFSGISYKSIGRPRLKINFSFTDYTYQKRVK